MKRIFTGLVVALVMAAMLAVMAAPAFADPPAAKNGGKGQPVINGGGNCPTGLQSGYQGAQNKCDRL
jgi:Spy/CpxP family protein refolding chaperone